MKACRRESMRLAPVFFATMRKMPHDLVLGGYQIPEGTKVVRLAAVTAISSEFFPNADKFVPERWIRGNKNFENNHPFGNLPFSHGARSCVAQGIARLIIDVAAYKLIQKYRLEYSGPSLTMKYDG